MVAGVHIERPAAIHTEGEWGERGVLQGRGDEKILQLQARWDLETGKMLGKEQRQELKVRHSVMEFYSSEGLERQLKTKASSTGHELENQDSSFFESLPGSPHTRSKKMLSISAETRTKVLMDPKL